VSSKKDGGKKSLPPGINGKLGSVGFEESKQKKGFQRAEPIREGGRNKKSKSVNDGRAGKTGVTKTYWIKKRERGGNLRGNRRLN